MPEFRVVQRVLRYRLSRERLPQQLSDDNNDNSHGAVLSVNAGCELINKLDRVDKVTIYKCILMSFRIL